MNISAPFIKRPVATTLLAIGIAISGLVALGILPVSSLPQIDYPTISVQASLPGASPEVMATSVATPLERQLSRIAGITEMTSRSSVGSANVTVQFDLSRDIDGAARDVQAAINASLKQLPIDLPGLPTYRKVNPSDSPILILALTSDIYSRGKMYDIASTILQQKLSQVAGVGRVVVGGSSLPAVRIELNPTALSSYGINIADVRRTVDQANNNRPKGHLTAAQQTSDIITNGQLFKAEQYKPLIIRYPVRVGDVAEVLDSVEDLRNSGYANNKPAVMLILFKQPGANVIEAVDNIREILPQLQASIPGGIKMTVMLDRTTTIRASLHEVEITLILAMILVLLVIYAFLRNFRASIIPSIVVPLSLLGTFGVMYLCGYSLDNLSLIALTIVTGFIVDDAVVVVENISRHLEAGMKPIQAAITGAKEVGFTVVSMSFSLIAVFIPILVMGGIVGRLFREFSITIAVAILMSLVISLTITPMMCARLLHPAWRAKQSYTGLHKFYERTLNWSLNHSRLILIITAITIALNVFMFVTIPKGFFPQQDTGRIIATIQARQNISFQAMRGKLEAFVSIVSKDPAVKNVAGFTSGTNAGTIYMVLKPLAERGVTVDEVINRLRPKLAKVPGATLFLRAAQDLLIGGRQSNAQYQYTITAPDLNTINTWTPKLVDALSTVPGIIDLNSDQQDQGLQTFVSIDRDKAARFGVSVQAIDNTLYDAFGQRQISTNYTLMNQYHVIMEVAPKYWQHPDTLKSIYVTSANNQQVPLSSFSKFTTTKNLLVVNHQGQFPAATISFNLLPGVSIGEVVDKINSKVETMHLESKDINGSFQGTAQAFQDSLANQPYLIMAAIVAIYIVLGILYESLIHPITILSTLPSAGLGALLALRITSVELSIIALIGIILLIGIVKKNAIMMVDFAIDLERNHNKSPQEAIYEACLLRFRPIMMTTLAALFGAIPLAFGTGVGSELRQPLGISIIGGLIISQMLTLYTTPVIYLTLDNLGNKYRRFWQNKKYARST